MLELWRADTSAISFLRELLALVQNREGVESIGAAGAGGGAMSGRGKSRRSLDLIDAAKIILEEIQPASVRAVCYRLFVEGYIDSMSKNNTGMVSKQLVYAREQGIIPWSHIVDETREAEYVNTWENPEELIAATVSGYRKDYWTTPPEWIEVWSEKGTVRGTLAPVVLRERVEIEILARLDVDAWNHAIEVEAAETESMSGILGAWRSICGQVSKYSDGAQ